MKFLKNLFSRNALPELNEVSAATRIDTFGKIVTPAFKKIGLDKWDGKYLWYSDFNENGIKHVIKYNILKGFDGSFSYGNCFSFLPTTTNDGKKLINHKTDKSTKLHLFERLDGWRESSEGTQRKNQYDKVSHWNEKDFLESLNKIIDSYPIRIEKWFKTYDSIDSNIALANDQIQKSGMYDFNAPNQKYVLIFLFAQKGDFKKAEELLDELYDSPTRNKSDRWSIEKELIQSRVNKMKSC
ncbi:hypothetical protein [Aquimarina algiphila]|uniref:DUF4304 domain-containing protein n=1 Tax=Aquimarina algiphila TaxID=2047982 RepID=A0A554VA64_9FLAO|nr:hypothetical protein [Aquimarina algiphila]TSE02759.1 hypothetical protein FOF46_30535 [Aquimarina algiphila]